MSSAKGPRTGTLDDVTFRWIDTQTQGRVTTCDNCLHRVWPKEPRMQYHDEKGKFLSKGRMSSYWCVDCAGRRGIHPPVVEVRGVQEGLFD